MLLNEGLSKSSLPGFRGTGALVVLLLLPLLYFGGEDSW